MNKKGPIGIFDSGAGGLTVLKAIERLLPYEDIVYFGDTARLPYGNKSKETIIKFSTQNLLFLLSKKVKMVVVACNTSSALALEYLQKTFSVPLVGVIEAGVRKALHVTSGGKIGIIGTPSTIQSKSYQRAILKRTKKVCVYPVSCPLFVPIVEEAIFSGTIINEVIRLYLMPLKTKKIDTIILGCTHYPLLKKAIAEYLEGVRVVDSAQEVAVHTKEILEYRQLLRSTPKGKDGPSAGRKPRPRGEGKQTALSLKRCRKVDFYVTDEPERFLKLARVFLKRKIPCPKVFHV